jgi:hypothetical protein
LVPPVELPAAGLPPLAVPPLVVAPASFEVVSKIEVAAGLPQAATVSTASKAHSRLPPRSSPLSMTRESTRKGAKLTGHQS